MEYQETEEDRLAEVFQRLDVHERRKISAKDIQLAFRTIGVSVTRARVDDIVWECDSDADGFLTLADIESMYYRAPQEASEFSPSRLLNLVEFLMYDPESSGFITVEDAMHIICRRFREQLSPALLRKFLLDTQLSPAKTLSFKEFVRQIRLRLKLAARSIT
ncbi:outer dynein arm docking complex 3 [Thecamonas trahens ATCC 50062]|uniref:Outer dynein arm docking complex 3 n=1 Tax=Thecamonas trahens ATCC 50062 TaxID=461836 RepID=A0A0L0D649_THETB|nr:outer dynein arm docking complex 3 [Thecamonas trahens ATCC 50062]KNC47551.1 outer dynein arm docking complex 3 [Thecamonas trahens ATCC 50062]|eukprot:XP_013759483.1 outer dynein arm docking complex 3 [Thecamonas trahens ATCC 50062]